MNTDARRKASAAYHAKRVSEGAKKVTVWLGADALAALDALKVEAGSKDKAAELAILAYGVVSANPGQVPKSLKAKAKPAQKGGAEPTPANPETAKPTEFKSRLKGQWKAP